MNIGDRVRLLRGTEEGVIVKKVSDTTVEIEVEDGFSFPVLRSEVVLVNSAEAAYFKKGRAPEQGTTNPAPEVVAEKGIFLAFEMRGNSYDLQLVNNTDYSLAFKVDELVQGSTLGYQSGHVGPKSWQFLGSRSAATFGNWANLGFTCLYFQKGVYKPKPFLSKVITFSAAPFAQKTGIIPLTGKKGAVFQLDEDTPAPLDTEQIRHAMLSPRHSAAGKPDISVPSTEVDLHLEKLTEGKAPLAEMPALAYQLEIFEKELDTAIAHGKNEITFIHGVGNGILRKEIHKRLSKMKNILYFQDARKEKFGYGATLIRIKD